MEALTDGWKKYILPYIPNNAQRLMRKHKVSISASIVLLALYLGYEKLTKAPRKLRHLPQASYWGGVIAAQLRKKPIDDFFNEYILPAAKKSDHGLYTRFDGDGWAVRITRPEAAKKFLLKPNIFVKANREEETKDTLGQRLNIGPNIAFLNGDAWRHQRMIANPAFYRSMPVDLFGTLTVKMFEYMDSHEGSVDFRDMMERFTLDAIGKAGFGFDFHSLEDKNSEWVLIYNDIITAIQNPVFLLFPLLDTKFRFLFPGRQSKHERLTKFLSMISGVIQSKREVLKESKKLRIKDTEKDLLTLLLEAGKEGGRSLTDEELLSNICVFFLAGHDTTANALSFAAYYLAVKPEIQKKAREEVIRVLGDDPKDILPTAEELKKMSYINMIIKEVLRMKGPASTLVPRVAVEDTDLAGVFVPKGTRVNLDVYALHHNPAVWKEPEVFDPERFAPGGEAERAGLAWLPFGNGSRQCLGMNFSLAEQRVLLSMLLRKYEFSLPENSIHKDKVVVEHYSLVTPKDLCIDFKRRY